MSEPVYGSAPYTATEKKIESAEAKSITGGGAESSNELSLEAPAENNPESDSMLDQLNEGKKQKLAPAIYSSFMHPRLQTIFVNLHHTTKNILFSFSNDLTF